MLTCQFCSDFLCRSWTQRRYRIFPKLRLLLQPKKRKWKIGINGLAPLSFSYPAFLCPSESEIFIASPLPHTRTAVEHFSYLTLSFCWPLESLYISWSWPLVSSLHTDRLNVGRWLRFLKVSVLWYIYTVVEASTISDFNVVGVGYGSMLGSFCVVSYYCSIMAITVFYFFSSFQKTLPWAACEESWAGPGFCDQNQTSIERGIMVAENGTERLSLAQLFFEWDLQLCPGV